MFPLYCALDVLVDNRQDQYTLETGGCFTTLNLVLVKLAYSCSALANQRQPLRHRPLLPASVSSNSTPSGSPTGPLATEEGAALRYSVSALGFHDSRRRCYGPGADVFRWGKCGC